ncbi:MAG: shikimate kinase [Verrucomicrobia bacterium]|nr:shikimate kinase [Verrucomicrobiota bacterium]
MKNLVLLGFMGSGKTTIGRLAAAELGLRFVDMDQWIEQRVGMSVADIFAQRGESAFRDLEAGAVGELALQPNLVIATGGGVVLRASNIATLARTGVLVHLRVNAETATLRTQGKTHRPLLQGEDAAGRIRALLAERQPLYDAIPHSVESVGHSPDEITRDVIRIYQTEG